MATVTVTRTGDAESAVSVNLATSDGTATAGSDYTALALTLDFASGETSKNVPVLITNDTTDEPDETVNLTLSNPTGGAALGSPSTATLTIMDDDAPPALSINDVTVTEGNAGTTTATFNVTLSPASGKTVTVNFSTADNTATSGSDYLSHSGILTFDPGQTLQTIAVSVNGDTLDEPDESFFVNLSSPSNATIADGQGVGTITDDDAPPTLSISDVTVTEGHTGTTDAVFNLTLSAASGQTVTVSFATADNTATAGSDYQATAGSVTFNPGETSKPITVLVIGDTVGEADETFFVNLSNPINATISDGQGVGTIIDDEAGAVRFSGADYVAAENGGAATITVTRVNGSAGAVAVNYATSDGTATAGADYTAASGTLDFAAGEVSKTFTVTILDDTLAEGGETINLALSNPAGGAVLGSPSTATLTITDNESPPVLSVSDVSVVEGNAGTVNATFNLTLSAASGQTVTVSFATADNTATAGSDYQATAGSVTFNPGETSKMVSVLVNGDTMNEPDETFFLNLTNPVNATILDGQGVATITNDDTPTIQFAPAAYTVNESAGTVTATVARTGDASGEAFVNYATFDGTATERKDYTAALGRLRFAPGETAKTFEVIITDDRFDDDGESFQRHLEQPGRGAARLAEHGLRLNHGQRRSRTAPARSRTRRLNRRSSSASTTPTFWAACRIRPASTSGSDRRPAAAPPTCWSAGSTSRRPSSSRLRIRRRAIWSTGPTKRRSANLPNKPVPLTAQRVSLQGRDRLVRGCRSEWATGSSNSKRTRSAFFNEFVTTHAVHLALQSADERAVRGRS